MAEIIIQPNKTTKQKLAVILALAVPAMIENILQTVVGFVDTLFVAKIGLNEVTAVGVANAIMAVYIAIFMAVGRYVIPNCQEYRGGGYGQSEINCPSIYIYFGYYWTAFWIDYTLFQ
ncbi:multi antimicrobial extrusion protein MatE [Mesobacillus boroniphilus JCM 21738]|uniref:Probable multidrug resistance protein NorM n=1 Tax=Mesobacillus boroniphilus JCM 21738 TaxID=1294265 RepID=W4RTY5_9BACI|nr:multi antimicrobial extrusion protein MatE [Mesobacillus boroniphilus JCM 21738]